MAKIEIIKFNSESYKKDESSLAQMFAFDCKKETINACFRDLLKDELHSYTYFFCDANDHKIISFVSFCASALQLVDEDGIKTLPAVELKLFGVDKGYQGKKVIIDEKEVKYSEYTFQWLIAYIKKMIQPFLSVEYLVLHAIDDKRTLGFYKKMGLAFIDIDHVLQDDFSEGCLPMYLKL